MYPAKLFIGTKVITPIGEGKVTGYKFAGGWMYFVAGAGIDRYFPFSELVFLSPPEPEQETVQYHHRRPKAIMQCRKAAFPTYKKAQDRLLYIMRNSSRWKKPVRAYKCRHCEKWHLTSKPLPSPIDPHPKPA